MAGELNTEVRDDPASCRSVADWLGQLAPGVGQLGDSVYRQRGESESFWEGTAGQACRGELTRQGEDGDTLEQLVTKARQALTDFAGKIDSVKAQFEQARSVARTGELVVTATAILPPGPAPGPVPQPPTGPASPQAQAQHNAASQAHAAASAQYERKRRAFEEASGIADRARNQQADAHVALDKAMKDPQESVKKLKTYAMYAVGNGLSWVKTTQTTANDLLESSKKMESAASTMQARAATMTHSPAMRELAERAAARGTDMAADIKGQYAQVQRMNSAIPEKARTAIEQNPGNLVKSGSTVGKVSKNVLRGLPYVGTGLTLASGGADVAMGKDPWNATADTAASLGGSIAGGMATGAAVGTVFPGAGTVVGGVVGGIAGGLVATGVVDWLQGD
ncbi:hypothetical protein EIL87_10230 [Saccharopolyspora rhizosphaerae]|uniref:Uncharacterized protein n=1 Tax=Saccharopolyspora rhizosphaerae TaxID=2492662 RepID=A0A3R8Q3F2_9PSEU|nr:hypothetical protein [Saccharopolyspora rhizosphaerae]RRO17642.1 hypothetical protein EIL87_10230 [Saccharopolyspora rhizosphaerae]